AAASQRARQGFASLCVIWSAVIVLGEAVLPPLDPLAETRHVVRGSSVSREVLVVEAPDLAEHSSEKPPVKASVGLESELAELIECVAATGDGGVDVQEVAGGRAVVKG